MKVSFSGHFASFNLVHWNSKFELLMLYSNNLIWICSFETRTVFSTAEFIHSFFHVPKSIGPSNGLFSIALYRPKDGAESVLLHKNSNKSFNIILHKTFSAPSFGCYWKQMIRRPYLANTMLLSESNLFLFYQKLWDRIYVTDEIMQKITKSTGNNECFATVENTSMNPMYFISMYWANICRLTVNF